MIDETVTRLEQMSEPDLTEYVRRRLLGRPSAPPVAWTRDELPEDFLVHASDATMDSDFRLRLKQVVGRLLQTWRPNVSEADYGGRLVALTGALRVEDGPTLLRALADDAMGEEIMIGDEPLSALARRTLLDFAGEENDDSWPSLLRDPQHFDTAYFAMVLRGFRDGLTHLPLYLQIARETGLAPGRIEFRIEDFISRYAQLGDGLVVAMRSVMNEGQSDQWEIVRTVVERQFPGAMVEADRPRRSTPVGGLFSHQSTIAVQLGVGRTLDYFHNSPGERYN